MHKRDCLYTTTCVDAEPRDILRMKVFAKQIKPVSFMQRCAGVAEFAKVLGFASISELRKCPYAKFYSSVYCNRKCFFAQIDGVKYVWCQESEVMAQ